MNAFRTELELPARRDALWGREWLVTNGLGGYASGTLADVATRRYHGIFMPNLAAPRGRHLMISRLDETLHHAGGVVQIGGAETADGKPQLSVHTGLCSFEIEGNSARWTYQFGELIIERRIVMPHFRNTLCVQWRLLRGGTATLGIRPYLPFRRQDAHLAETRLGAFRVVIPAEGDLEISLERSELVLRLSMAGADFVAEAAEAREQLLRREQLRGYEHIESVASPGLFRITLRESEPVALLATTEPWMLLNRDAGQLFAAERKRVAALIQNADVGEDPFAVQLVAAADQFLILPEDRANQIATANAEEHPRRSVIAGYHWFADWGRDTMISLEGLMLVTRRHREARATLLTFASYVRDGLLPNLFPEGAREGLYHTADATLWYFHAIHRYLLASGDTTLLADLLPVLRSIMENHLRGTRFGIHCDPADGLLIAATSAHALTWMDAHMGDWIVTPRRGKPVEIQALWYNALCLMQEWETTPEARDAYAERAALVRRVFNQRFWNPTSGCLFDVIDGEHGDDARLRPNQLLAISLDHPVLDLTFWAAVVNVVERRLLTPLGLRTLDPADSDYRSYYQGGLRARDAAYHQGTAWPWLLGPFIEAVLRVDRTPQRARTLLAAFPRHLHEAGIGSISEVFDGDAPHGAHGCIAQAWSVAEILRVWLLTADSRAAGVNSLPRPSLRT